MYSKTIKMETYHMKNHDHKTFLDQAIIEKELKYVTCRKTGVKTVLVGFLFTVIVSSFVFSQSAAIDSVEEVDLLQKTYKEMVSSVFISIHPYDEQTIVSHVREKINNSATED